MSDTHSVDFVVSGTPFAEVLAISLGRAENMVFCQPYLGHSWGLDHKTSVESGQSAQAVQPFL
jgi:hypothetical protein